MKLIAHRGNISGIDSERENSPDYIDEAISQGYDVEIDAWYDTKTEKILLGHDEPTYEVNWYWLGGRRDNLWIHCKNIQALYQFTYGTGGFNFFWHQKDDYTLTSKNHIWTYPGKSITPMSVIVMPEWVIKEKFEDLRALNCYGICSDYVGRLK